MLDAPVDLGVRSLGVSSTGAVDRPTASLRWAVACTRHIRVNVGSPQPYHQPHTGPDLGERCLSTVSTDAMTTTIL